MSARHTARTIRRALELLLELPAEAQALLAEQLIDRIDAAGLDPEVEEDNEDGCDAEDIPLSGRHGIGDADDAELNGDDESSLGWPERMIQHIDTSPGEPDLELDGSDNEPSLGWPEDRINCLLAAGDVGSDRERDTADDEPDADGEPSNGSSVGEDDAWFSGRPYLVRPTSITRRGRPIEACELRVIGQERRLPCRESGA